MRDRMKFNRRQWFILLIISFAIFFSVVRVSYDEERSANVVEKFIRDVVVSVENVLFAPFRYVETSIENLQGLLSFYDEYKELKTDLDDYALLVAQNGELLHENESLKTLLSLEETMTDYELITSQVIIRDYDGWNNTLIIDVGSNDGIEKDMAVISKDGLIGRVSKVNSTNSEIKLITANDLKNLISASIQATDQDVHGLIDNYDVEKNILTFNSIQSETDITPGEIVVTSGFGGVYPRGLLIGTVVSQEKDQYDLTQIVKIKPYANFTDLRYVHVVKRFSE
jgi:rod shape-determining protein MreC